MRRSLVALLSLLLVSSAFPARATHDLLVEIYDDEFGVPHVVAQSFEGASYGAGYVIGRDRLFQTDVLRRLGSGRLSEILGAGDNDGQLRADMAMRQEFYDPADIEAQYQALPTEIKRALEQFAVGFNQALAEQLADATKKSAVVTALGYEPEPWRPQDSLIVLMLFTTVTFAGEGAGGELENAVLLDQLIDQHGEQIGTGLWNDRLMRSDDAAPAVVPHGEGPAPSFVSADEPDAAQLALVGAPGIAAAARAEADLMLTLRAVMDQLPFPRIGSYAMAANGSKTETGKGLLLGAPQAGFFAPNIFYELGIHAPGVDCSGFTVPGLGPFIGIGWCNDHAWTLVAGNAGDQVDMVVEKLCANGKGVLYDGECEPTRRRTETYIVKSTTSGQAPRVETQEILSTRHGPVFRLDEAAGYAFVFQRAQTGHFAKTIRGTHALTTASSFEQIEAGARDITATYNFVYADREGNIAYRFTGYQPKRAQTIDHRLPTPGWNSAYEWQARTLAFEDMPHVTNPSTEFLVVNQGVDSKPISWWPRSSSISISRFGHTMSDQLRFAGETGMDIDRVKQLNRLLISDEDGQMNIVEQIVDDALAGSSDPQIQEIYALFDEWRDSGFKRTRTGSVLAEPAVAVLGVDGLTGFPRAPVWDRFMNKIWAPAGGQPRAGVVGRIGWTLAAITEGDALFSVDYSAGWQQKFRDALVESLPEVKAKWSCTDLSACRATAPTVRFEAIGLLTPSRMDVVDHGTYSQIVDLDAEQGVNILPPGNGRADTALDIALHETTGALPDNLTDQIELYENFDFKPMKMRAEQYRAGTPTILLHPSAH